MSIVLYVRGPTVGCVEVTAENAPEVAAWCGGRATGEPVGVILPCGVLVISGGWVVCVDGQYVAATPSGST